MNITNICLGSISWLKEFRIRKGCIQRDLKEDRIAKEHATERKSSGEQDIAYAFKVGLVRAEKELLEEETANDALIMTREQHFLFLMINFEQMKWQPS